MVLQRNFAVSNWDQYWGQGVDLGVVIRVYADFFASKMKSITAVFHGLEFVVRL